MRNGGVSKKPTYIYNRNHLIKNMANIDKKVSFKENILSIKRHYHTTKLLSRYNFCFYKGIICRLIFSSRRHKYKKYLAYGK